MYTFINIGGGDDERKRPFFILDALNKAFVNQVQLVFVAKVEIEPMLKEYAKKIKFKHKLVFYPRLKPKELMNVLDKSHVLISASEFESFGLTIIEANARGIPVVCSKSGGPNDLVKPFTGLLFEVDDLNGFIRALQRMKKNYHDFDAVKIAKYAHDNFSERIYSENLISEIKEFL